VLPGERGNSKEFLVQAGRKKSASYLLGACSVRHGLVEMGKDRARAWVDLPKKIYEVGSPSNGTEIGVLSLGGVLDITQVDTSALLLTWAIGESIRRWDEGERDIR